jgi:hypothetical protein
MNGEVYKDPSRELADYRLSNYICWQTFFGGYFGKKAAGEIWKNSPSFLMWLTVSWRCPLSTADTIDSVLKIGTRSFCRKPNSTSKAFNSSTP